MSISSSTRKAGPFACNGSTVAFPFAFKVFTTADVRVVLTDSNGVESDLALGTNYTVALNADQDANPGGTVTTTATYATGYLITLTSQVQNLQPVTLTNQGGFYPQVINNALDRLTIMAQQLAEQVSRAVKTSISSSSTPDQLLSDIGAAVTNASNSATAAAGSATNSANSATASANSATASAGSATAAANSATQAANSAASVGFTLTDLQTQSKTAATSAGAAPAFTVATNPAYGALAAGQRMRVKFHAAGTTGSNTLNRDGLGAKNLMQYDATGTKVAAVVASGQLADVEYDGVDMVILDPLPVATSSVPVRQTVLSGPVDSSGLSAFGGATGSTTVAASGTLIPTAANGFDANGEVNRIGSITNPSWTGLSTNGTIFLYLDIAADGSCTTGSTTLAPTYQWGGTYSTTSGQFTFNIQEMVGKVGSGAAAAQTYRVFVGEVTVAGGVVTAITWYALMGRYDSGYTTPMTSAGVLVSKNSNLGLTVGVDARMIAECVTAELNYVVGDTVENMTTVSGSAALPLSICKSRTTVSYATGNAASSWNVINKTTGVNAIVTNANWKYKLVAKREW